MKATKAIVLLAIGLILLLTACRQEKQEKPISEMTCVEAEEAYADCDNISRFFNHIKNCREKYYPVLWRCYGVKE